MQEPSSNNNQPSFVMSMEKSQELIDAVTKFEYKALGDILKAQGFQFKNKTKLLHFIQFNLIKTVDPKGKWVRYQVFNPVTKDTNFLFQLNKEIMINADGGASLNLTIQTTE